MFVDFCFVLIVYFAYLFILRVLFVRLYLYSCLFVLFCFPCFVCFVSFCLFCVVCFCFVVVLLSLLMLFPRKYPPLSPCPSLPQGGRWGEGEGARGKSHHPIARHLFIENVAFVVKGAETT